MKEYCMKSYNVKEVAEQAGVSEEIVRRWIRSGRLEASQPSRKQGNSITEESLAKFVSSSLANATRLTGLIGGTAILVPAAGLPLGAAAIVAGATGFFSSVYSSLRASVEQDGTVEKLAKVIREAGKEAGKMRASIKKKRERIDELTSEIRTEQDLVDQYDELIRDANKRMLELIAEDKEGTQ